MRGPMTLRCFVPGSFDVNLLDRSSFQCRHTLLDHPSLHLDVLAEVIPRLPAEQVMYATRRLGTGANFEQTFRHRPKEAITQVIEGLKASDSFIMVRSPETHPSFADLHRQLIEDVTHLMRRRHVGSTPINPQLYLFIASPNSITPFHIDRYSTLLLQFRGTKRVTVFPQWDEQVVASKPLEDYVAYRDTSLTWTRDLDALGRTYEFTPGEALHIPFAAGHHVANGSDDISVSLSIIFNTRESMRWKRALQFNSALRPKLSRMGLGMESVGHDALRDSAKALVWRSLETVHHLRGSLKSATAIPIRARTARSTAP